MMLIKRIYDKSLLNILDFLFLFIILNIIPMSLLGLFNIPNSIYQVLVGTVYLIQSIILLFLFIDKILLITKNEKIFLSIFIINCFFSGMYSFLICNSIPIKEIIYDISLLYNIFFFIICARKFAVEEEELKNFLKKMLLLGIFSVIINIVLNIENLPSLMLQTNSYSYQFKSFFPNRNQFGMFMLIMIFLNSIMMKYKKDKYLKIIQVMFILNLFFSMSRTAMLGLGVFCVSLMFDKFLVEKEKNRKTMKYLLVSIFVLVIAVSVLFIIFPDLFNVLNRLFFRFENIKNGSGRFDVWKNGLLIARNNIIFGVGRFQGLNLNKLLFNNGLTQFHSIYIEKIVYHGLLGLICLIILLLMVWKSINKIDMRIRKYIKASFLTFLVISIFETTTRFSIGYTDILFMIIFFTIPLMLSNTEKLN